MRFCVVIHRGRFEAVHELRSDENIIDEYFDSVRDGRLFQVRAKLLPRVHGLMDFGCDFFVYVKLIVQLVSASVKRMTSSLFKRRCAHFVLLKVSPK